MKIKLHKNDLPNSLKLGNTIAIDTEAMGLNHQRDRLCLVQLSNGKGTCHLVQIGSIKHKPKNLIVLLKNKKVLKIFHFARF
ncbi:MAG: ribonuclease D, partial [Alphaproteobacteria bacterium]|nr:ribonuclease D [Alphaproteobacteria bacterium]